MDTMKNMPQHRISFFETRRRYLREVATVVSAQRWATVRWGIDTLIANILVSFCFASVWRFCLCFSLAVSFRVHICLDMAYYGIVRQNRQNNVDCIRPMPDESKSKIVRMKSINASSILRNRNAYRKMMSAKEKRGIQQRMLLICKINGLAYDECGTRRAIKWKLLMRTAVVTN